MFCDADLQQARLRGLVSVVIVHTNVQLLALLDCLYVVVLLM